ncbi:hypothetical protein WA158_006616 [Blastocystis sp. Blastoise]
MPRGSKSTSKSAKNTKETEVEETETVETNTTVEEHNDVTPEEKPEAKEEPKVEKTTEQPKEEEYKEEEKEEEKKPTVKRTTSDVEVVDLKQRKLYVPQTNAVDYYALLTSDYLNDIQKETGARLTLLGSKDPKDDEEPLFVLIIATSDEQMQSANSTLQSLYEDTELAKRTLAHYKPVVAAVTPVVASTPAIGPSIVPSIHPLQPITPLSSLGTKFSDSVGPHVTRPVDIYDDISLVTVTMDVPRDLVGLIIGKRGETLRALQMQHGISMALQRDDEIAPGAPSRIMTLRGTRDKVESAKAAIELLMQTKNTLNIGIAQPPAMAYTTPVAPMGYGAYATTTTPAAPTAQNGYDSFAIPNDKVGLVIGRQGATVKGIMNKSRVTVTIPQVPDNEDPSKRTITITGTASGVAEARRDILAIVAGQMNVVTPALPQCKIVVPDEKVGLIIGKNGQTFRELQNRTNCRMNIPKFADEHTDPPVRTITLLGTPEQQQHMKNEINNLIGEPIHDPSQPAMATDPNAVSQIWQQYYEYYGADRMNQYIQEYYKSMGAAQPGMPPAPTPAPTPAPAAPVSSMYSAYPNAYTATSNTMPAYPSAYTATPATPAAPVAPRQDTYSNMYSNYTYGANPTNTGMPQGGYGQYH